MFCANCGNKLADGSKFCPSCGTKVGNIIEAKQTISFDSVPQAATVYFEQGIEYLAQKDSKNAADAFNAAIKIAPNYYEAKKELVKIYSSGEENEIAIDLLEKMLIERPDDAEAFLLRAELYIKLDHLDKALMDLNIAKKINPDLHEIYGAFGKIFTVQKEYKKVIENYSKAIKLNSKKIKYYLGRGNAYFFENMHEKAIEDYSKALSLKKDNEEALYGRGMSLFKLNKYDDALADFNKLLSINQEDIDYLGIHGRICFLKEDYKKAISSFAYCMSIMDKSKEYNNLEPFEYHAKACLKLKKYKDVREDYVRILDIAPDYQFKDTSYYIDGLTGYFEDGFKKYESDKKTFVLIGKKGSNNQKEGRFVDINGICEGKRLSILYSYPIVFFCEEHARDYSDTPWTYWLREHKYPIRESDYRYNQESERNRNTPIERRYNLPERNQYNIIQNKLNEAPSFWFIIHMPSGKVYNRNKEGKIKFENTDKGYPVEGNNSRFKTIEEAILMYKELIKNLLDKKAEGKSSYEIYSYFNLYFGKETQKYDLRCDDFFIAGTYNTETLEALKAANPTHTTSDCFITSAVCRTLGKTDNCSELMLFRHFRDTYMCDSIEKITEIKEYYNIAPKICKNIETMENDGNIIYQKIWNNYLKKALIAINNYELDKAYRIYKKMVLDLKDTYILEK